MEVRRELPSFIVSLFTGDLLLPEHSWVKRGTQMKVSNNAHKVTSCHYSTHSVRPGIKYTTFQPICYLTCKIPCHEIIAMLTRDRRPFKVVFSLISAWPQHSSFRGPLTMEAHSLKSLFPHYAVWQAGVRRQAFGPCM